ncbi:papain-like cysteine protease family protein [Paenibacillus sp. FSL R5-0519]|uniref:papain-like cysteine protease family protein n=1 Tax=Paenibacillus TaxID=44249 RepID=UPI0030D8B723
MKFNKRLMKQSLILASLLFLVMVSYAGASALSLPKVKQEKTNWCWVASSIMILKFYGINNVSQCEFYKTAKKASSCENNTGYNYESQRGMHTYGVSSNEYSGALDAGTLSQQVVTSSRPVYVNWQWTAGGGHAVVAKWTEYYSNTNYVSYNDPWDGTSNTMAYNSFKGGSGYDRRWDSGLKDMWHYK